jgi:uncharacterized protein (DUF2164 family)
MKKIENSILWLQQANKALQEVENYLRELNHELDKRHDEYIMHEIIADYGADKSEQIWEFVAYELGNKHYDMTVREVMDEIGSADQCEWCGLTTNEFSSEVITWLGDEKLCITCKSGG